MSSVPHHRDLRRTALLRKIGLCLLLFGALSVASGCRRAAQVTRINPGEVPETYRVTCVQSFRTCRMEIKELCDREFYVLDQQSNHEELPEVGQTGVSSTGPPSGLPDFRGEITFRCGRPVKPLRLVRKPAVGEPDQATAGEARGKPTAPASTASASPESKSPVARVCVPGATQACLGPGACAGAQACLTDGTGFGPCDCGSAASNGRRDAAPATTPDALPETTRPSSAPSASAAPSVDAPGGSAAPGLEGEAPPLAPPAPGDPNALPESRQ